MDTKEIFTKNLVTEISEVAIPVMQKSNSLNIDSKNSSQLLLSAKLIHHLFIIF